MNTVIQLPYKAKRTSHELIRDVLKNNAIKFQLISETEAIPYLEDRNYYYKLACYRKSFRKNKKQKYIDLDFQYLISISKIDKKLRYILLQMTLEIEHFLKVTLLKDISYNDDVDGYEIVNDYLSSYNARHIDKQISIESLIERGKNQSSVNHGIYNKVKSNSFYIAIWQLIEIMQLQELEFFFGYYFSRFTRPHIDIKTYKTLLISSRYIRNATAHNNPLLINLPSCPLDAFTPNGRVNNRYITKLLREHFDNARVDIAIRPTYRFKDIASVLALYKLLQPNLKDDPIIKDLKEFLLDISSTPPCPKENNDIITFFNNMHKLFKSIYI